jgi:hypothetical protein
VCVTSVSDCCVCVCCVCVSAKFNRVHNCCLLTQSRAKAINIRRGEGISFELYKSICTVRGGVISFFFSLFQ